MTFAVNLNVSGRVDHYFHGAIDEGAIESKFDQVLTLLNALQAQGVQTMADLSALQTAVENEGTVVQSAIVLLQGLAAQVADLKPDPAAIAELAAKINASAQALSDAVVANTPVAPAP